MMVTVDLKLIGWGLVIICLVILLIYCIFLVRNLIATVKSTNKILQDAETISGIAADRTEELNTAVGDVSKSVRGIADALKGNQSIVSAVSTLMKAFASLKNLIKRDADE